MPSPARPLPGPLPARGARAIIYVRYGNNGTARYGTVITVWFVKWYINKFGKIFTVRYRTVRYESVNQRTVRLRTVRYRYGTVDEPFDFGTVPYDR